MWSRFTLKNLAAGEIALATSLLASNGNPLSDLHKQGDQFALAVGVRLGKDRFQLIARRLP